MSLSNTATQASASAQESNVGPWVGTLRLRSHAGLIDLHSAAEQPRAQPSRREDREYLEPYESPQPEWWPSGRGVPDFRPLNTDLDVTLRPWSNTPEEVMFVRTMLSGVLVIGMANRVWRSTFGRISSKLWEYPIGGTY